MFGVPGFSASSVTIAQGSWAGMTSRLAGMIEESYPNSGARFGARLMHRPVVALEANQW
jgi:hypothetical protein